MKKILTLLVAIMLLVSTAVTAMAAYNIDTAKQSIVRIMVLYTIDDPNAAGYGSGTMAALGSGFAVGDVDDSSVEYIMTAGHVVMHNAESVNSVETTALLPDNNGNLGYFHVTVQEIRVLMNDASSYVLANFAGCSDRADVAVLRLNTPISNRKPAVLLNTMEFETNATLTAMGFPGQSDANLDEIVASQLLASTNDVTVNKGSFSRTSTHATTGYGDMIQTTAEMSPGMSGGALVDDNGYVVGVVNGGADSDNVNYAVATGEVVRLLRSLTGVKYTVGPLKPALSLTMIILIAVAALVIIVLLVLIITSNNKKNARSLTFNGVLAGKVVPLKRGASVIVGRDPKKCQVIYPSETPGVSGVHCTISYDGNQVPVADAGSSYGTFVGGVKVEPGRPAVMHRGQVITFGSDKNVAELH